MQVVGARGGGGGGGSEVVEETGVAAPVTIGSSGWRTRTASLEGELSAGCGIATRGGDEATLLGDVSLAPLLLPAWDAENIQVPFTYVARAAIARPLALISCSRCLPLATGCGCGTRQLGVRTPNMVTVP